MGLPIHDESAVERFAEFEEFLRRIPPWLYDFDKQEVQSWAFANDDEYPDRFSVNWEKHSSVEHTLEGHSGFGVVSLTAGLLYSEKQEILHTPQTDSFAHCDVIGEKKKARQRRLRNSAKLLQQPTSS